MFFRKNKRLCNAPYNSIFFAFDGKVYFCLRNKKLLIGQYPKQNVKEIIEGSNISILRKRFDENLFPEGCEFCKYQYENNNEEAALYNIYKNQKLNKKFFPSVVDFELSNQCNLSCLMCSSEFSSVIARNENVVLNNNVYDKTFADEIFIYAPYIKEASFRGGEPFMIDLYHYMWENLLKLNPEICINVTTNALILNEKIKKILENGRFNINISIDTLNPNLYERIRKGGSFDRFKENLEFFYELRNKKLCNLFTCVCLMKINWHEMPEIFAYANANGLKIFINYVEIPRQLSLLTMDENEMNDVIQYFNMHGFSAKDSISKANLLTYQSMINTLVHWKKIIGEKRNFYDEIQKNASGQKELFLKKLYDFQSKKVIEKTDVIRLEKLLAEFLKNTAGPVNPEVIFLQLNKQDINDIKQHLNDYNDDKLRNLLMKTYNDLLDSYYLNKI